MATYKVIQDIEAEDKFVGPLTLKQFVFAMFGALFGYLSFVVAAKGLAWGLIVTSPPMLFGFFMAVPWSSEQPTDVWFLAKIRFRLKPQRRIWDQAGLQELVTITAPKKQEKPKTKDLTQSEVQSRLKALAETIDSRGWVIKNVPLQNQPGATDSDRLVSPEILPTQAETTTAAVPDILEEKRSLDSMILEHDQARRAEVYERMDQARYGEEATEPGKAPEPTILPADELYSSEQAVLDSLKSAKLPANIATGNMHTLSVNGATDIKHAASEGSGESRARSAQKTEVKKARTSVTEPTSPDILKLAGRNDLNISTIARQANAKGAEKGSDEVVVSFH
jgi:hypothetical protein